MSTGIVLPYETAAQRNDPMPDGLIFPDQLMYQSLALLYTRYRLGAIDRDRATAEKTKLLLEYEAIKTKWSMGDHFVARLKSTERARAEYRKDKTLGNADKILIAFDGVI